MVVFICIQILIEYSILKQIVETLFRRHILWHLFWVFTVHLCPTKRMLGLNGLRELQCLSKAFVSGLSSWIQKERTRVCQSKYLMFLQEKFRLNPEHLCVNFRKFVFRNLEFASRENKVGTQEGKVIMRRLKAVNKV